LGAPHPAIGDAGVQKDDGVAPTDDFRGELSTATRNLMFGANGSILTAAGRR
jgi:hypothetical protein